MKIKNLFGLLTATLLLASCGTPTPGQNSSSSSSTSSSSEVKEPEIIDPPAVEGDYISLHYQRKDKRYGNWGLWLWEVGQPGAQFFFNGKDEFGAIGKYALSTWSDKVINNGLGFIIKTGNGWDGAEKDFEKDRFIDFSRLNKTDDGGYNVYLKEEDGNIYTTPDLKMNDDIFVCEFKDYSSITVTTSNPVVNYSVTENGTEIIAADLEEATTEFEIAIPETKELVLTNEYIVKVKFEETQAEMTKNISLINLYKTDTFDQQFTYTGNDLGATYTNEKTTFKVWSPISSEISVRIYNNGTPVSVSEEKGDDTIYKTIPMVKNEKGVFEGSIGEDVGGKYYTYVVTNSENKAKEIVDPYAKSAGVNGLRGQIVDFSKTNPVSNEVWDDIEAIPYDRKELVVYETHVSDLTASSTWTGTEANRKKFNGAYETNTKYTKDGVTVTTGFDHIKELGVNAVQLLPIFDQANDEVKLTFNWGYNPLNYNCLEGGYSSDPYDGYTRIKEFKALVKAYHDEGINIIMDVVYNHVNSANGSNFDVLMPQYYYRYKADGALSNGSGCGNETASELPMMRKFMIDSTSFWAKEFKLGGFRFDLMGLHDIETMNQLTAEVKKINPNICIYGEPWTGGDTPLPQEDRALQANGNKFVGFGQFNDQFRDGLIAGGMSHVSNTGWADEEMVVNLAVTPKVRSGLQGFTNAGATKINDPDKTVNYVTCHDNYTLYDRFKAAGIKDETKLKNMAVLANSMVMTSQGTSFMLAGEEFLRTKGGDHNSYMSSYEVNALNYDLKIQHADMFEMYKKLVAFKTDVDGMHLDKQNAGKLTISFNKTNVFSYEIKDTETGLTYKIFHRNGVKPEQEIKENLSGYSVYLSTQGTASVDANTMIKPFETLIVSK